MDFKTISYQKNDLCFRIFFQDLENLLEYIIFLIYHLEVFINKQTPRWNLYRIEFVDFLFLFLILLIGN